MSILTIYILKVNFIFLSFSYFILRLYLNFRQKIQLTKSYEELNSNLKICILKEDYHKSSQYEKAKLLFNDLQILINFIFWLVLFLFRGLDFIFVKTSSFTSSPLINDMIFIGVFFLIQTVLSLPFKYYHQFYLQERFKFNLSTPKIFWMDQLKYLLLNFVLGIILIVPLLNFITLYPQSWWWISAIFICAFQFLIIFLWPNFIAPLFNKFSPFENLDLKEKIELLVKRSGWELKEIQVMDASKRTAHSNAYFTGLGRFKKIVFFDTLLKQLTPNELLAVLAHELGHLKHKHITKRLLLNIIMVFLGLYFLNLMIFQAAFYQIHFSKFLSPGLGLVLFSIVSSYYLFYLSPIFSYFSRKQEFQADQYAVGEVGILDLKNALLKIHQKNASHPVVDRLYAFIYFSHPPLTTRIERLEEKKIP